MMRADRVGGSLSALDVGKGILARQFYNSVAKTSRQKEGEQKKIKTQNNLSEDQGYLE